MVRVLAPSDEREKQKRPRPQDKRVWASLAKEPEEVLAEAPKPNDEPSPRKSWVGLVDGNATQLEILNKLAGQHHVELTIVLDFIHVCEYVWKASLGFYEETEPARQAWVQERLLRILRGEATLVAARMRRSATRRDLKPDKRDNVDRCADYLLNHEPYLRYTRIPRRRIPDRYRRDRRCLSPPGVGPHGPDRSALVSGWRRSHAASSRSSLQRRLR